MLYVIFRKGKDEDSYKSVLLYNEYDNENVNTLLGVLNDGGNYEYMSLVLHQVDRDDICWHTTGSLDLLVRLVDGKPANVLDVGTRYCEMKKMMDLLNQEVYDERTSYKMYRLAEKELAG